MQTLQQAIAAFQRDVSAALADSDRTAKGLRWQAERVSLSLELLMEEPETGSAGASPTWRVRPTHPDAKSAGRGHSVSIEFRVAGFEAAEDSAPSPALAPPILEPRPVASAPIESEAERVVRELSAIFGPPGFDSSARAAVFCDAVRGLTAAQASALCESFNAPVKEVTDDTVRRSRHLLMGVIRSGPLKSPDRAAEILIDLFERCPIPTLLKLVEEQWRTQDDWKS